MKGFLMKKIIGLVICMTHFAFGSPCHLTKEQAQQLQQKGYVVLEGILDKEEVELVRTIVDGIVAAYQIKEWDNAFAKGSHGKDYYNIRTALDYTSGLDYLIDHPKLYDVITSLMGHNIHITTFNLFVRKPCTQSTDNKLGLFHVDVGATSKKTAANFPMQINVQFFLTDLPDENAGNFMVVPGTHFNHLSDGYHQIAECNKYLEKDLLPPGTVQIKAKAGDVLIHFLEVWHAVAPNYSNNTRKSIGLRYGQKSVRNENFKINPDILGRMTTRQRGLLS